MIGWLIERIFVDRKGRESRKKLRRLKKDAAPRAATPPARQAKQAKPAKTAGPEVPKEAAAGSSEREQLINDAMTIFRQRRAEYEKLDDFLRDRIDKAANEAFGDKDK